MKQIKKHVTVFALMLSIVFGSNLASATDTQAATKKVYLGKYTLTAYCSCKKCCGKYGKRTASGTKPKQGRTIAVDKKKIKLGTKIQISGKTYTAEDTGSAIKGNRIDIYFSSHKKALKFGKKKKIKVYKIVKSASANSTPSVLSANVETQVQTDVAALESISNDAVQTADNIVDTITQ